MMTLRPHHLLCTFAYRGNGYSQAFVQNFDNELAKLQAKDAKITLQLGNDAICQACPQKASTTHCQTESHIRELDAAVLTTFGLETDVPYSYQELIEHLLAEMTPTKFKSCCQTCSWFQYGICEPIWCAK